MMLGLKCVFAVSCCCCFMILAVSRVTDPSEVDALVGVLNKLIDPMRHLRHWKKGDPCTSKWTGVVCFNTFGADGYLHVRELQLLNRNLSGNLAPELGKLTQLEILDFMWNDLSGTIPKEIGNISSLILLLLNGNNLSGRLPSELGNLSNLDRFQIDQNYISGPIPKSFAKMSSMKHLHMNNNSISGQLPPELSNLTSLLHILVDSNNLWGYLPKEYSTLPDLRILQLDNNNFSGYEIPTAYGNFSRLVKLSLRNCSLQGNIPDISKLRKLKYLDLSRNHLTGSLPTNKLSNRITTFDLSHNQLNGSIPISFSDLPSLQTLSLESNLLSGFVPKTIWEKISFNATAILTVDLRNNSLSQLSGNLDPPYNVTLRLGGNPICNSANLLNVSRFCGNVSGLDTMFMNETNTALGCPIQSCPTDFYQYVPVSPGVCFCASPIWIGYRLKSPSFTYFPPYKSSFEVYLTRELNFERYQLSIDSYEWEEGPRLRMYLKLFPARIDVNTNTFNSSEVQRIRAKYTTWKFWGDDFFGPYELLNFTLLGPYAHEVVTERSTISKGRLAAIAVGVVASAVVISAIVALLIVRRYANRHRALSRRRLSSIQGMKIDGVKDFDFTEMALATDNFNSSCLVGRGGYGKVYKGVLPDKTLVAIKRALEGSLQGQKEFLTEIELLSRLHHRNLVSLIGYCDAEGDQMLVYEFMPNGTLRDWLSARSKQSLNFCTRMRIALGSAKGILYLHTEANPPVFHRDIKASNILLDSNMNAKVADFGLSRLAPFLEEEGIVPNHVSTVVKGTPGYLDPEYFLTRKLTDKSDVYSLGVVFLELLTGMHPISDGKNIVREVKMAHESGRILLIIDSRMGAYPSECVERFVGLAISCCRDMPEKRPSVSDIVREIEFILKIMPEMEAAFSESSSLHWGKSSSMESSSGVTDDQCMPLSYECGSNLISSVAPTIVPR